MTSTIRVDPPRMLTAEERELVQWMLQHGETPDAKDFVSQLNHASVVSRCSCGCPSIDFAVEGLEAPSGGLRVLGDYIFGPREALAQAFVFERGGVLAGIEVISPAGDPLELPAPTALRLWSEW